MTGLIESMLPSMRLRAADATAAAQVLERVERAEEAGPAGRSARPRSTMRVDVRALLGHPARAEMHWRPSPIDTLSESTTATGRSPSSAFAATCADCMVPESRDERLMHTMPSAPSAASARKRSSNAPGDGAAVSGSTGEVATLRQNSSFESSTRSTNSSSPNRIVSGHDLDAERVGAGLRAGRTRCR